MVPALTAALVYQHLFNKAKGSSHLFNELLQHVAIERFIYRLPTYMLKR
jgi:hypothetical protein